MKNSLKAACAALLCLLAAGCNTVRNGHHELHILTTNDVHGSYFDSTYVSDNVRPSLFAVKYYVDSVRAAVGAENVLLLDAGDCLQGDNAAYYFNYVDTMSRHIYPRIAKYMGYDAIAVGNHDIETGRRVYDRVTTDLCFAGISFLAGNAVRAADGKPYFPAYKVFRKAGMKVLVIGYTNANIKAWLDESLWKGLEFRSVAEVVQADVDRLVAREKPQVVVVAMHSGTGKGDGSQLESQGLDVLQTLRGVDVVVCAHDHRPLTVVRDSICLLNAGSHARKLAHGVVSVDVKGRKVQARHLEAGLIDVAADKADAQMREAFRADYEAVKAFTLREVGELEHDLLTRDSYVGMCDYMNLIHTVSISAEPAVISFAAPLTFDGKVKGGKLVFNDMFTIYPFENQLFVAEMTGSEIKNYLECSYDKWIQTINAAGQHVLRIRQQPDPRTGSDKWSFTSASYNFDSAAGIRYTVDVTRPMGERVNIASMADGSAFEMEATYPVAMTSYRASGGGGLLAEGAGISPEEMQKRIVRKYPELRELIYEYVQSQGVVRSEAVGDQGVIGEWHFVPEKLASQALAADFALLFPSGK